MKRILLLLIFTSIALGANELTKVGVIDVNKVYQRYIKDSAKARKFDKYKAQLEKDISTRKIEIDQIEQELIKARDDDDESLVAELESDLQVKKLNLQEYVRHKNRELNALISTDASKREFSEKLQDAVSRIASREGYSIIMVKRDPAIFWYHNEVDITEQVIQGLVE